MRVIICGAGQVGYNIAAYLSREDNDVTIIDVNPLIIAQINDDLDVNGIVGHGSSPDVLDQAGASDADIIIAVTHSDEINMVACQVAHSLFNVPKKIARVRDQHYLDPAWSNLFSRQHMPIDVIVSPEIEVARAISQRLSVPGTTNVIPLADGKVHFAGVTCNEKCPVVNTPLRQLTNLFPDLNVEVVAMVRGTQALLPDSDDQILIGDEVFFCVDTRHLRRALVAFGHEEKEARRLVIVGGGNIGYELVSLLVREQKDLRIKVIERDEDRAVYLSEQLERVVVLHGDGLDRDILEEADIEHAETLIAVTDDDEANILGSILAKQYGCERVITLVNKNVYMPLINHLGIDAVVSPRAITVSTIMQNVRRGRIKALHNIRDGFAEVIEAEASDTSTIVNTPIEELDLPQQIIIGAIVRKDLVIIPRPDTVIRAGDRVIILATQGQARRIERMFSVQVDLM
ncbi:MAG: Trk system potassium transporter TrkA [Alphaproteobacteria bacterium]|nr:Trk system potassium transporter TrkA [Alphaproteobacteria bacterium]